MRIVVAAATDVGRVRANNEDSFLVDDAHGCFAVADGMGGHLGGEVASATAIEAVRAAVAGGISIDGAIQVANDAVLARAAADPALTGMGTTLTGLTAGDDAIVIGHVGDSRAYLLRDGALRMLTDDHSLVGELIREGRLTVEQAEVHPQRSVITRCLGTGPGVRVDTIAIPVVPGDRILLCSDGLTTMLRDDAIAELVAVDAHPDEVAVRLVDAACDAGGDDNVTVVVIDIEAVDTVAGPRSTSIAAVAPEPVSASPDAVDPSAMRTAAGGRRRSILLLVAPLLVIAAAIAVLGWYARGSYFIGERNGVVVIYQGVPGGVVGWNPTVREEPLPRLRVTDLTDDEQMRVDDETIRESLNELRSVIGGWRAGVSDRASTSTTSTTTLPETTTTFTRPTSTRAPPP